MKKLQKNLKIVFAHLTLAVIQKILFKTILFGLVFKLSKKSVINKEIIEQVLGKKFFMISQEKKLLQLEVSFCNFEKITLCSK